MLLNILIRLKINGATFRHFHMWMRLRITFIVGNLDHPEYLLYELSKMEHFRERVDFLRFRYRAQWQLFEMGMTQF